MTPKFILRRAGRVLPALVLVWLAVLLTMIMTSPPASAQASRYRAELTRTAHAEVGLDAPVALFAAQIHQESGWNLVAMNSEQAEFGRRLRAALKAAGLGESAVQLADLVSGHGGDAVSPQAAHNWIRGKTLPRPGNLKALARALGTRPDLLYGELADAGQETATPSCNHRTLASRDQRTVNAFLILPPRQREAIRALIEALAGN
jgi:transcriptional regulator with XRE-family HTH domain